LLQVRIQLERADDGKVLAARVVDKSFEKALTVSGVRPGSYRIRVGTADGARPPAMGRRYRWTVLVSTDDVIPYPRLPADARVRLVSADCRSLTVEWSTAESRQRYCVYAEAMTSGHRRQRQDACPRPPRRRRPSAKVSCHVTGSGGSSNGTLVQTIAGAKAGRRYAVDVYASTTKSGEFVVYERLIVDVPTTC